MVYNGTGISGLITYQTYLKSNTFLQNINLVLAHFLTGPKTVLDHLITERVRTREMKENKPNYFF